MGMDDKNYAELPTGQLIVKKYEKWSIFQAQPLIIIRDFPYESMHSI